MAINKNSANVDRVLSSPNSMVWELFSALRRLCNRVSQTQSAQDESDIRQDAALSIILAVQCVEVFFNVYFRVLIDEPAYSHAAPQLSADLANTNFGLDKKIKDWPLLVFGKKMPLDKGPGQRFLKLKEMRNELTHFKSTHETVSFPGVEIQGMADTTLYHSLTRVSSSETLATAEDFICEVFRLRHIPIANWPFELHSWTGKPVAVLAPLKKL